MQNLADLIEGGLKNYRNEVQEKLNKAADETAKDTVKELKATSPKRYGNYGKSWTTKKEKQGGSETQIVHNKKHYQLTHLLENGHATKNGGRTRAFVHIKPAEQNAIKGFEEKVRDSLES